jgi:hypothetical protein
MGTRDSRIERRLRTITFPLLALFFCQVSWGTEPPCTYPTCFRGEVPLESRVFTAPHIALEIHRVGRLAEADLVLLRYTAAKGGTAPIVRGFLVTSQTSAVERVFVRFPEVGLPELRLDGALGNAKTAEMSWGKSHYEGVLSYDEKATRKVDRKRVVRELRDQLAQQALNSALVEAEKELQKTKTAIEAKCESKILVSQNVQAFLKTDEFDAQDFAFRCAELLKPLGELCPQRKRAAASIRKVECRYSKKATSSMSLGPDGLLTIHTSVVAPRDGKGSFDSQHWLNENLK